MRILFCLGDYYKERIGGAEIQSYLLIKELMNLGHDVSYIYNGDRTSMDPVTDEDGIEIYTVERPRYGIKTFHYLHKKDIWKLLERISPDAIYQRGDYHFLDIMTNYGYRNSIPVFSALSMERHCHQHKVHLSASFPLQLINRYLINRYYQRSTIVISQTTSQQTRFKKNFSKDSIIIPIGHPVPDSVEKKEETIIWVANIKPIKQPEKFVELASRLEDTGIRFVMVGGPDEKAYQDKIEHLIGKANNVEYLGRKELDDTNDLLAKSLLLVNTSESEGFSNTFVQSWMRGTPVVSMNTDPDSLITDNDIGILEPDLDLLEKKVRSLIDNRNLLEEMSKRARKVATEKFDIEAVARDLESIFLANISK